MRRARPWLLWIAIFVGGTALLLAMRTSVDQAHVVLAYLLLVLGGSVSGGRWLGLTLSLAAFGVIDYAFQPPYETLGTHKPLDFTTLFAFLATATVATQLLARAQAEAAAARRRADEVLWLSRLGSESLSAGRAEEALEAIAEAIRRTFGVAECRILRAEEGALALAARGVAHEVPAPDALPRLIQWVARSGHAAGVRADGHTVHATRPASDDEPLPLDASGLVVLLFPLRVQSRVVGTLALIDDRPMALDAARQRFLLALAYYAALGVERTRLVAAAEHAEALREAARLRDVLLASVSHDLRTPLTSIKALAQEAARRGDVAAPAIEEQADRLTRMVADLLDLSRLRSASFPVSPELNTAEDLLGALRRHVAGLPGAGRVHFTVDVSQPALLGRFDFVQTLRILGNLVENALRYSPAESVVEVSARAEGDHLLFEVADRGPGIPPEELTRIFEPFYRPPGATPDAGRAGLGLSIARRLAEAQEGSLEYQPRAGGGSVFVLELPAARLEASEVG